MKKYLIPISGLLIGLLFIIMTLLHYPLYNHNMTLISYNNEYVEKYASKEKYKLTKLSDSEYKELKKTVSLNIEEFDYNRTGNNIEITNYKGVSKNLIIPNKIDGYNVTSIKKGALKNVESITISKLITSIDIEDMKNIKINCYSNDYCNELKSNDSLKVNILNDSDKVVFDNTVSNFEYNYSDNKIEVTSYSGDKLIIPETINGYEVKTVSLELKDLPTSIYLPTTVTSITSITTEKTIGNLIYLPIIIEVLATIIFLVVTIILSNIKKDKKVYVLSLYIISYMYLFYVLYQNSKIFGLSLVPSLISSFVYIIIAIVLLSYLNRLYNYDKKVEHVNNFINDALALAHNYQNKELIEVIKYSDPVTSEATKAIEDEIKLDLQNNVDANVIIEKVKRRNTICKQNK